MARASTEHWYGCPLCGRSARSSRDLTAMGCEGKHIELMPVEEAEKRLEDLPEGPRTFGHWSRPDYCSCGKIVHGNGARYQHRAMHERAEDEHRYVRADYYRELFPDYKGGPSDRRVPGLREPGR